MPKFYWPVLGMMWCIALFAMYNQGVLDTLRCVQAMLKAERPLKHTTSWKDIAFYIVPLAVFTALGVFGTVH
jgi:hypothetical protein